MYPIIKRLIDIVGSILGLLLLSPILIIIAILIRLTLGKPVMFCHVRPGLHAKPFRMIKFRTMTNECDENGNLLPDERRVTKFGLFLRKTSIDELPELLNVLKGDMSLVGPRPLLMKYLPYYTPEEQKRHNVRPGITGLAQISGRNTLPWNERLKIDVEYVERYSLILDTYIIFCTIGCVFRQKNIVLNMMLDLDVERSKSLHTEQ
ncbi:MAG: sugar transferase [Planctomycetaceae bacterium]|jgi:lipopolysaccharide/colanic/teichoic acid biosynthesis glycosyltransferase|nr:sugar transferase [Planctomycetaceae bacterium]